MSKSLPARPNLEQLKNQAKELFKLIKSGDAETLRLVRANHPRFAGTSLASIGAEKLSLVDAQLVIAREYGFETWPKLKKEVNSILLDAADHIDLFTQA